MEAQPRPIRTVALVEPRSPGFHIWTRFALPRLGVVLLGTILRDQGYRVDVQVEEAAPLDIPALERADLVGISAITSTAPRAYELADHLRQRGVPVVMGGPHPTHLAEEALQHADYVVRGEGEEALPALIRALETGRGLDAVPNLSWRHEGAIRHNPQAPFVADLDAYPDPDLSLVPGAGVAGFLRGRRVIPIQTSRGCPYDCSFCSVVPTFGRTMRYRSVDRVVAEIQRHGTTGTLFFFYDDNFAASPRRARELCEAMACLPQRPRWSAQVRADVARDPDLLDLMVRSGCDTFFIGLESVNDETLQAADKRQQLEDVHEHLRRIRARGIEVHGMFVLGFDTDAPGTMERTVALAREHDLLSVQFLILTPLPGSRLHRDLEAEGRILVRDWSLYDAHHVCFRPAQVTPAELQRWQLEGHARFYSLREIWRRVRARHVKGVAIATYARSLNRRWERAHGSWLADLGGWSTPRSRPMSQPDRAG